MVGRQWAAIGATGGAASSLGAGVLIRRTSQWARPRSDPLSPSGTPRAKVAPAGPSPGQLVKWLPAT